LNSIVGTAIHPGVMVTFESYKKIRVFIFDGPFNLLQAAIDLMLEEK